MCLAFEMKTFRVLNGVISKSHDTNCAKVGSLKMGVALFKLASCMYY